MRQFLADTQKHVETHNLGKLLHAIRKGQLNILRPNKTQQRILEKLEKEYRHYIISNKLEWYKKLIDSKRLEASQVRQALDRIPLHNTHYLFQFFYYSEADYQKLIAQIDLLERISGAALNFLSTGDESCLALIKSYETDYLLNHATARDLSFFPFVTFFCALESKNDFFIKQIRLRIKDLTLLKRRDLRYCFRSIIKFYFKNMDDESGDHVIVDLHQAKQLFDHSFLKYGTQTNYR